MQIKLIMSTDLLSRGIDLPDVRFVVNFDMPLSEAEYFHRIGRTGRFGKNGIAVSFITERDLKEPYISKLVKTMNEIGKNEDFWAEVETL